MTRRAIIALAVVSILAQAAASRADFLVISLGGSKLILQGQITAGKTVIYTNPTLGKQLYFRLEDVKIVRTPTPQQVYGKMVAKAGQDADGVLQAGVYALKKGMVKQFDDSVDKALKIDPNHAKAKRIVEIKKLMDEPLPDDPKVEQELRAIKSGSSFRVEKSKHFILLTDVPKEKDRKKDKAQKRLDLLEQVYQSFLLLFLSQDVDLDLPKDRMKVVLFNDYLDYREFSTAISPSLSSASGFWEHDRNVSVFFAHGSTPIFKILKKIQGDIKKLADEAKKARAPGTADLVRFAATIDFLIELDGENSDITVVSHEGTHQMAGNTGLFPRHVMVPSWVHEGLATYFEAPGDATWAGIGAVNEERLTFYNILEPDREHSNIDFIVGDQIFDYAASIQGTLHGYAQAWALTHFMLENHPKEFVEFYRILGEMPPDTQMNPELLTSLFNKVFGTDRKQLDQEWRAYMRTLKTDMQRLEEEGKLGG